VLSGLVSATNDRTMTLQTLGEEVVLERAGVLETKRLADSMMPPGLIEGLSGEEVRDLIGYLMHSGQVALPGE
jgi:hypothetical protein